MKKIKNRAKSTQVRPNYVIHAKLCMSQTSTCLTGFAVSMTKASVESDLKFLDQQTNRQRGYNVDYNKPPLTV